ncbi:MAG: NDP-hexose 2,3-dehydratase family protein [Chromatiales bacterium]
MVDSALVFRDPVVAENVKTAQRFLVSGATTDSALFTMDQFHTWFAERTDIHRFDVSAIPFGDLVDWHFQSGSGNLMHASGRFFSIEGLRVRTDRQWVGDWTQPIIVQPEIGVLGILVKELDGVLHCLMQAKMEPGNINTVQLSPTVQATRSNYTGVHRGNTIKYLDYFMGVLPGRALVDVLQSEQGAWFLHKRNRNMVVEALDEVPLDDDFCWLTLGQIRRLLGVSNVVNMDARTVLSCIPTTVSVPGGDLGHDVDDGSFAVALARSLHGGSRPLKSTREILSWLTDVRARSELVQERISLSRVAEGGWYRTADQIAHRDDKYFKVIAVNVTASNREVRSWTQPLVAPMEPGLLALLMKRIGGEMHALVQTRVDAGSLNVAELAPSVHCQPGNYRDAPAGYRPPYLDYVLSVNPARIRYDVLQSEEGGRFYHAQNRYVVIEVDEDFPEEVPTSYEWVVLNQLTSLLVHSNYLNVELRSVIACAQTLC